MLAGSGETLPQPGANLYRDSFEVLGRPAVASVRNHSGRGSEMLRNPGDFDAVSNDASKAFTPLIYLLLVFLKSVGTCHQLRRID